MFLTKDGRRVLRPPAGVREIVRVSAKQMTRLMKLNNPRVSPGSTKRNGLMCVV